MTAVDPSREMLGHARHKSDDVRWVNSYSDDMPFSTGEFSGAVATLTIHHWPNRRASFTEIRRILKTGTRFVIFSSTPEQMNSYWIGHYFPRTMASTIWRMPTAETVSLALVAAGFTEPRCVPWFVPDDLMDLFWYAGKDRSDLYFDPTYRAGISGFREYCSDHELEDGLRRLRSDLDTGHWREVRRAAETLIGDYCFFVAEAV